MRYAVQFFEATVEEKDKDGKVKKKKVTAFHAPILEMAKKDPFIIINAAPLSKCTHVVTTSLSIEELKEYNKVISVKKV